MGNYLPGVRRDFDDVPRGSSRDGMAHRTPANRQSLSGIAVSTHSGGYRAGRSAFTSPVYQSCRYVDGVSDQGMGTYPPR